MLQGRRGLSGVGLPQPVLPHAGGVGPAVGLPVVRQRHEDGPEHLGVGLVRREGRQAGQGRGITGQAAGVQRLRKLELPLAMPTIVAGVNQTIMLALSMAVIAAMIGARGLGGEVWKAIQRLQIGNGFEAGLGIVIVAITLDRLFRALAQKCAGQN